MARIKSKQFKKDYAASMDNIPMGGVWSGRGIGIPVAGAIGGGDDAQQKIGRPKRPYYQGDAGSPNMAADATFSSYLSRVNKGHDDYDPGAMFPEQEDEEHDSYSGEYFIPKTRKLPRSSSQMKRKLRFNENTVVENSRYSLVDLFEQAESAPNPNLSAPRLKDIVTDVLGDAIFWAADKFGFDVSGVLVVIPAVAVNMYQINSATNRGEELLEEFRANPSDDLAREIDDVMKDITRDIVDIIQRLIEALPIPMPFGEEDVSFITGQALTYGASTVIRSSSEMWTDLLDKVPEPVRAILEWMPVAPTFSGVAGGIMKGVISQGLDIVGQLHKALVEYKEGTLQGPLDGGPLEVQPISHLPVEDEPERGVSKADLYSAILSGDESSLREIRQVIREAISAYHPPMPTGFAYRDVPEIVSKEDAEDQFDLIDNYDDFAVMYKTDNGVASYQSRNKIDEVNVYRWSVLAGLEESKKKN
tara:strand:+ start:525 stop:1949 length:1425 start_codon:yes stop_codon:yes gene_type:complete